MMKFGRKTRFTTLVALVLVLSTGFTYYKGLGEVIYQVNTYLTEDILYDEQIAINSDGGVQHAFVTDIDTLGGSVMPYVFVGDVTGKCTMTYMTTLLKEEGYTVIAGINGDFYDTVTGAPLGMSIHDGKIKNTGATYSNAIGFREDGSAFVAPVVLTHTFTINDGEPYPFGEINKPKGAANGLHFYNRQYGEFTKTSGDNIEVVLEAEINPEPVINETTSAIVKSIHLNTFNTPIGENEIVLSADSTTSNAAILATLIEGDKVTFSVTDEQNIWSEAKEAIGAYQIIAQDGLVTVNDTSLNPRTCIGIKDDGSVMLFTVDGRSPGYSVGMKLVDIANYLIERGCTTVVNMDGGGSTTLLTRMPGYEDSKVINRPSDGKERSISNGLIFVKKDVGNNRLDKLHIYPLTTYMMPGSEMQLEVKATDNKYGPVIVPNNLKYAIDSYVGNITEDGLIIAGENEAEGEVIVRSNTFKAVKDIKVTKEISFYPDTNNVIIEPGNATDIGVKAYSMLYIPVVSSDNLFTWECDARIGSIDQNGLFVAASQTGVSGRIYISYNGEKKVIPVQVGPPKVPFDDTGEHWAKQYIEILSSKGIVNGMGDNLFQPDIQLTKAQFLTMLANIAYDLKIEDPSIQNFKDVNGEEWYAKYVNWAYENKIVNGNPDGTFQPDTPITREQMALILNNFVTAEEITYETVNEAVVFTDQSNISPWSYDAVNMVALAGIINGRPEGNYDPQGFATRAEASKVIYGVVNLIER